MNLYPLLFEVMVLLGVWLCLAVWQKDPNTPGRRTFALATLAWTIWCFGELAGGRGLLDWPDARRLVNLGALLLAPLWIGVAAQTARLEIARRVPWIAVPLLTPGICVIAIMFSDRWHGLFAVTNADGSQIHGPMWPIMEAYGLTLGFAGCCIMVAAAFRWRGPGEEMRRFAIAVAPLITLAGSALYFGGVWRPSVDPTPLLLGITLLALHRGIFAGGLLQPLSISQHALVQQLPLGIILADRNGVVVDVNRVAERRLGVLASKAIGRNVEAVIDAANAGVRFEVTPVLSAGSEAGQIVLLDPPDKEDPAARNVSSRGRIV